MIKNKYNECKGCVNESTCKHANKYIQCVYRNNRKWKDFYLKRFMRVI
jgi:hypothetical protein